MKLMTNFDFMVFLDELKQIFLTPIIGCIDLGTILLVMILFSICLSIICHFSER